MSAVNRPETTYFIGNSEAVTRLHAARTADNSVAYLLPQLRRLCEKSANFTFLDVGCGPGSITLDLARQFPQATFVGIDGSSEVIGQAEKAQQAASGITNCRFEVGDVMKLHEQGFTNFDVAHVHQLLQHVPDPPSALTSLRKAVKPDSGIVAVREADWGMFAWYPDSRGLSLNRDLWIRTAQAMGNDPHVAKRLHVLAQQAGWGAEQIDYQYDGLWFYGRPERRQSLAASMVGRYDESGAFADRLREQGYKEIEVKLAMLREGWSEWAQTADAWYVMPCCSIICYNSASKA